MNKKERLILIELMNNEYVSGQDLAYAIQMSVRSVNSIIKNITCSIKGARIESGSFGYRLAIIDPEAFLSYLQQEDQPQDEIHRFQYMFKRFMETSGYVRIDDLCDELHLSRTSVKQVLKEVRSYFEEYGISIRAKPHYGMCLDGSEFNKRRAMAHWQYLEKDKTILDKINAIVVSSIAGLEGGGYQVSDDALSCIVLYLYIAYVRVKDKNYIDLDRQWLEEARTQEEYSLGCGIMMLMGQMLQMECCEAETAYLTLHLCGKNNRRKAEICVSQEIFGLVDEMMDILRQEAHILLSEDLNLRMTLSLHMVSLIKRIRYKTYTKNPLLTDIKTKLLAAYELAVRAAGVINQHYRCVLPEDETGYLAIYINLSLEKELDNIRKKNILLVCSSGVGSAKLMEYYFQQNFKAYIRKLTICSAMELKEQDVDQYDCVFSTIPVTQQISVPVFLIDHFVSHKDTQQITQRLKALDRFDIKQYFPKELFFAADSFENREDAIHTIVERCRMHYKLPWDFEKLVLERERMSSTEFHEMAAFPHACKPMTDTTFVAVSVLKKPLLWKNSRVRIIMLSSIEQGVSKNLDVFYKVISTLLSDAHVQWKLMEHPTYDNLIDIIERIEV